MEVGRNDLCPCESGKKYKKCCMKKEQVVEIGQVKLERFFRLKQQLVEQLTDEAYKFFSIQEIQSLTKEFASRVKVSVPESFFQHWLLFFYYDQNGMRSIERYNHTWKHNEPQLKELAAKWERLQPRLIQQVDYDEQGVIMEDLFTNERFHMPFCETMPEWVPLAGTFCMLEEFAGGFYINGVAASVASDQVKQAFDLLAQHKKETESSYHKIAMDLYPEILQALLAKPVAAKKQSEMKRTELHDEVQNMAAITETFKEDERFQIMEEIGIPFEEADQFYVRDLLDCFKEKGAGKSQSTYYKYRLGLQTIGYFLSQKTLSTWSEIDKKDWEKWFSYNYLAFNMDATVNQVKGFMTVVKSFAAKIDETYGTAHAPIVRSIAKEMEPSILAAVNTLEAYVPYQTRRNEPRFSLDYLMEIIYSAPVTTGNTVEAMWQIKDIDGGGIKVNLLGANGPTYTVAVAEENLTELEQGMLMAGRLSKDTEWQISHMNGVFPAQAAQFILKEQLNPVK